ncbi:OHCU decarboxylase [Betaproteobacteria bacterium GR16-43]|nr:OHCU decarboxylase [Betaproteobacteria bacterium GR16-43]
MSLVGELNGLSLEAFVARLGSIYEHSPWVAERAYADVPFASIDTLHRAMERAMFSATADEQMALIRAHPELAGRLAAAQLTEHSRREQAGSGLDRVTPDERARMQALNDRYREKFGFPFIVAVKGLDWSGIIERMEARLPNAREVEVATALEQIGRIARFRLDALA